MVTWLLLGLAGHQGVGMVAMRLERRRKYAAAEQLAAELGKPFLIVGGPYGSAPLHIKAHGCGDLCVDISALACQGCEYQPADIRSLPFADAQFGAVFCSHVLEHMPSAVDCQTAWRELHRVADYVFICVPPKSSIWAHFVPDHYLWVKQEGEVLKVQERATGKSFLLTL